MKILNKFVEFIESLISKVRKLVHLEVSVTFEKPVEKVETTEKTVETPTEVPVTSEKPVEQVKTTEKTVEKPVKAVKRRGRPRKVKPE